MEIKYEKFIQEFKKIKKMGYVESISNYRSRAGDTFEKLLGKERDELFLPDYNEIEIKTKKGYSQSPITLFSANPDSIYYYALKNLVDNYGTLKNGNPSLVLTVDAIKNAYLGNYAFKLFIDKENEIIRLNIYDKSGNIINNDVGWTFSLLKERISIKLQHLALVKCCTRVVDKKEHYWFYRAFIYQELTFESFLKALEDGHIHILFSVGTYKSGPKVGKMHNHGTCFRIPEIYLPGLYQKMFST